MLLLDVFEHIKDRRQYLQQIYRELPNCRQLVITVPARMELWSGYDEHWGHHLRYDRPGLEAELSESGFAPEKTAYFFHWVYLASLHNGAARLCQKNALPANRKPWTQDLLPPCAGADDRSRVETGFRRGRRIIHHLQGARTTQLPGDTSNSGAPCGQQAQKL